MGATHINLWFSLSGLFSIGKQIHPHPTPPPSRGRDNVLLSIKGECRKVGDLDK
jgi:hypothetical protein